MALGALFAQAGQLVSESNSSGIAALASPLTKGSISPHATAARMSAAQSPRTPLERLDAPGGWLAKRGLADARHRDVFELITATCAARSS